MRIGQTSLVVFVSKLLGSALGFVATLYFARELGAEILGVYAVVMALTSWFAIGSTLGIDNSMKKRISEGVERGQYLTAGLIAIGFLTAIAVVIIHLGRPVLEDYTTAFSSHVGVSVVWFLVVILLSRMFMTVVENALHGLRLVHIAGVLQPVKIGGQSLIQIGLVILGFGLVGMLIGHVLGVLIVAVIGAYFISVRPELPERKHFQQLTDYAKYAWVGAIKSKTYTNVDILVLQALVATSLVGVYSVAWGIATIFNVFGGAITQTVFPEISNISAAEGSESASGIIEDALAYTGFLLIPGLVGGLLIGDRVLRIYGPEFVQGTQILGLILVAMLLHGYMNQFLNALNALDRPELPFRINSIFIGGNLLFNVILVLQFGWIGAAIASVASTGLGLYLGHRALQGVVSIEYPWGEFVRQLIAASAMGLVVWGLLTAIETTRVITHNFLIVIGLVVIGGSVYFVGLVTISPRFRSTIYANLPDRFSIVG